MPLKVRDGFVHAVDYGNDLFLTDIRNLCRRDYDPMPPIGDLLGDYLDHAGALKYPFASSLGATKECQIHEQRERICRNLLQKIAEVRQMTDEEADWTLDIVGGDSGYLF